MRYQRQAPRRIDPAHHSSEAGGYPMGHAGLSPRLSPIMENPKHLAQKRGEVPSVLQCSQDITIGVIDRSALQFFDLASLGSGIWGRTRA